MSCRFPLPPISTLVFPRNIGFLRIATFNNLALPLLIILRSKSYRFTQPIRRCFRGPTQSTKPTQRHASRETCSCTSWKTTRRSSQEAFRKVKSISFQVCLRGITGQRIHLRWTNGKKQQGPNRLAPVLFRQPT